MIKKALFLCFLLAFLLPKGGIAQNSYGSEEELKKEAERLFEEESFSEGFNLFAQLLSIYPKDPNYNFKFGVCMLMTGEDKEKPIPYLEFAAKSKDADKDVLFYLAKAYHLNYRFDPAITTYKKFKEEASKSKIAKYDVDRHIQQCENGKRLLNNISDLYVLEKKELSASEYFRSYDLSKIGGKLLVKLDEFKTSYDKKMGESSIIYLSPQNNEIFYSSYGKDGKNGKDIYLVKRKPNGEWSEPEIVPGINTPYDEDYPFLHPNGNVLYFSSKGHNSMGGYDVFKSTFNTSTKQWSKPVNVDFPISTPGDDILYVTDKDESTAYFSSDRSSTYGKLTVFKIGVERKPVDVTIVSGNLKNMNAEGVKDAKITVKDIETGDLVGSYNTTVDGDFSIYLPGGGKYLYTVEAPGEEARSEVVEIPEDGNIKNVEQELAFTSDNKVEIKTNLNVQREGYSSALSFIKQKANMEVNTSETAFAEKLNAVEVDTEVESSATEDTTETVAVENTEQSVSNLDVVAIAKQDADDAAEEAEGLKEQAQQAHEFAELKKEAAGIKRNEEITLKREIASMEDGPEKSLKQNQLKEVQEEYQKLSKEAVVAHNIANKVSKDAALKEEQAKLAKSYAEGLELAVNSSNPEEARKKLEVQKLKLDSIAELSSTNDGTDAYSAIQAEADYKKEELAKAEEKQEVLEREVVNLGEEIENLKTDAEKTKNDDLRAAINEQIKELESDKVLREKEVEENKLVVARLKEESATLTNEASVVSSMKGEETSEVPVDTTTEAVAIVTESVTPTETEQVETVNTTTETDTKEPTVEETFAAKEEEAKQIDDELKRTEALALVYEEWTNELFREIDAKKKEMVGARDENYKRLLAKQIEEMEVALEDKKALAATNNGKAAELAFAKEKGVSTSDTASSENIVTSDIVSLDELSESYESKINSIGNDSDPIQLERKKELYEELIDTLDWQILALNEKIENAASEEEKVDLQNKVTSYNEVKKNKTIELEQLIEANKEEPVDTTEAIVTASVSPLEVQDSTALEVDSLETEIATVNIVENDTLAITEAELVQADTVESTRPDTAAVLAVTESTNDDSKRVIAKLLDEQANDIRGQANIERTKAYNAEDPEERDMYLANAQKLDLDAKEKQMKAAAIEEELVDEKFNSNGAQLDELKQISSKNTSDQIALADVVNDESKIYYEKAKKLRKEAEEQNSYATRQSKLNDAKENEELALQSQQRALDMYKKFYPDYTQGETPVVAATETVSQQPTATDTSASENVTNEIDSVTVAASTTPTVETPVVTESTSDTTTNAVTVTETEAIEPVEDTIQVNEPVAVQTATNNAIAEVVEPTVTEDTTQNTDEPVATVTTTPKEVEEPVTPVSTNTTSPSALEQLTPQELAEVKSTSEYKKYLGMHSEADVTDREAKQEVEGAEKYKMLAKREQAEANALIEQMNTSNNEVEKQELSVKVREHNEQAALHYASADSLERLSKNTKLTAQAKRREADLYLESLTDEKYNKVVVAAKQSGLEVPEPRKTTTVASNNIAPSNNATTNNTNNSNNRTSTNTNNSSVLRLTGQPAYSASNPIPMDIDLPNGIVYKIQIGAFRNAVSPDQFGGISPLAGESTPQGFVRYTAGLFRQLSDARVARDKIRGLGYRDAFIVAFKDGERVSVSSVSENAIALNDPTTNTSSASSTQENNVVANNSISTPLENGQAASKDLNNINGLFYTVQVGVYSKPVTAQQLFNVQPLFSERTSSGLLRYTTGLFDKYALADATKRSIVNIGIRDAFVIAYKDGQRTSLSDARALEQSGNAGKVTHPDLNREPVATSNTNTSTTVPLPNTSNNTSTLREDPSLKVGKYYSVQVGYYRQQIPVEVANRLLSIAGKYGGVKSLKDDSGATVYFIGKLNTYDEAASMKQQVVSDGIGDAFVISFENGVKVPATR